MIDVFFFLLQNYGAAIPTRNSRQKGLIYIVTQFL